MTGGRHPCLVLALARAGLLVLLAGEMLAPTLHGVAMTLAVTATAVPLTILMCATPRRARARRAYREHHRY